MRIRRSLPLVALLGALLAPAALAWPVDLFVDVEAGEEKFTRFEGVDWVEVEDPKIASAESFSSGEVLITGHAPGKTLLLAYGQGRFSVWRVTVSAKGQRPARPPVDATGLSKSCPGTRLEGKTLRAKVSDERCRLALRAFLETDAIRAEDLDLTFELAALQAQLQDIGKGLALKGLSTQVQVRYLGAGLVLTGKVTHAQHHALLWELFRRSAGRAPLEDRLELPEPPARDGGEGDAEQPATR